MSDIGPEISLLGTISRAAGGVIGDVTQAGINDAHFLGQEDFRGQGHAHDVCAGVVIQGDFAGCFQAGTFGADVDACLVHRAVGIITGCHEGGAGGGMKSRAEGYAFMCSHKVSVIEGGDAGAGEVDQVMGNNQIADFQVAGNGPHAVPGVDGSDPEHVCCPDQRPVINESSGAGQLIGPMAGTEGDGRESRVGLEESDGRRRTIRCFEHNGIAQGWYGVRSRPYAAVPPIMRSL